MFIIKKNNFEIKPINPLGNSIRTNLSLEIVKKLKNNTYISICRVNKDGDILSIWDRVLMEIDTQEELDNIKELVKILQLIMKTDEIIIEKDNI